MEWLSSKLLYFFVAKEPDFIQGLTQKRDGKFLPLKCGGVYLEGEVCWGGGRANFIMNILTFLMSKFNLHYLKIINHAIFFF